MLGKHQVDSGEATDPRPRPWNADACRGMAVAHPEGDIAWKGKQYSLVIDDYPYAEDGMLIWNSLRKWVSEYLQVGLWSTSEQP